jgi:hypothetical protein
MNAHRWLSGALALGLTLSAAGCKQEKAPETEDKPPAVKPPSKVTPVPDLPSRTDVRSGIGKMLPSVQRHDAGMDLRNIAQLYAADHLTGSPPKKVEDLKGLDARAVEAIKDGTYVVLWNANPNAPGTAIVAYEKDVPTKGGMAADLTGTVKRMTAQEFQTATKASGR